MSDLKIEDIENVGKGIQPSRKAILDVNGVKQETKDALEKHDFKGDLALWFNQTQNGPNTISLNDFLNSDLERLGLILEKIEFIGFEKFKAIRTDSNKFNLRYELVSSMGSEYGLDMYTNDEFQQLLNDFFA